MYSWISLEIENDSRCSARRYSSTNVLMTPSFVSTSGAWMSNVPPELKRKFDELDRYIAELHPDDNPDRSRGFLIQILHRAQGLFGYLPEDVQKFVASRLKLSPAEVYGVISFYSYFTDKPVGRYKINF